MTRNAVILCILMVFSPSAHAQQPHVDLAGAMMRLARLHESLEEFAAAQLLREQIVSVQSKLHGAQAWQTTDARLALAHVEKLMRLGAMGREDLKEADGWMRKSHAANKPGSYEEAAELAERALAIRLRVLGEDSADAAWSALLAGYLWHQAGQLKKARPHYDRVLAIRKKILGDLHPDTAAILNNLCWLLRHQGDYANSRVCGEQSLAIRRKILGDHHPDTAQSWNSLGVLLDYQGDYEAARPCYEQALAIYRKSHGSDHPSTAAVLNNLGLLLCDQQEYGASRACYLEALAIRRKLFGDEHPQTAATWQGLANVCFRLKEYDEARRYYEKTLAIRKKTLGADNRYTLNTLSSLGAVLLNQGDYAAAQPCLEQALNIRKKMLGQKHPDIAESMSGLANLFVRQGKFDDARPFLLEALAICRLNLELSAANQSEREQFRMANVLRHQLNEYLSFVAASGHGGPEVYGHVYSWKGAVTARQRMLKQAIEEPALSPLARQLQQTTTQLAHLAFAVPDPKTQEPWIRQIEKLTREKEQLERELAVRSKDIGGLSAEPKVEELIQRLPADVALIDFLQYHHVAPGKEKGQWQSQIRVLAFVVRSSGKVRMVELDEVGSIEAAVKEWRGDMRKASSPAGAKLRRLLWQPLEQHLHGVKTVLVSPDGVLNQLPFAALPGKEPGSYLIEDYAVVAAPLPRWLPQLLQAKPAAKDGMPSLLLVGDVDFAAPSAGKDGKNAAVAMAPRSGLFKDWRALPGTRGEIATIRDSFEQRFPDGKVKVLRGGAATESALQQWAPRHSILHLATHGFFAPATVKSALAPTPRGAADHSFSLFNRDGISGFNPGLLSGIVLAGANRPPEPGQDDGILTALAVAEMDLRKVELVVLSACETGLGEVAGGEGVLGLQRAFQIAGAKTVVASLWSVDDEATRKLMERFYENLWQKKMTRADAMRQAQLAMLRGELVRGAAREEEPGNRRLPPYYWAAFVLSGDWR